MVTNVFKKTLGESRCPSKHLVLRATHTAA